jgi:hypothetical protein
MIDAQILIYHYNDILTTRGGREKNRYVIKNVVVNNLEELKTSIEDSLDEVPVGRGYSLVKTNNELFICERDTVNHKIPYAIHKISYHPLQSKFQ